MPWTCQTCAVELLDHVLTCPTCGAEKAAWTIVADKTRGMVLPSRSKLEVLHQGAPAEHAPATPAAEAAALAAAGGQPAPAQLLIARLTPRKGSPDRTVAVTVELEADDPRDHVFTDDGAPLSEAGTYELPLLCVYGAEELDPEAFPGVRVVDVSDPDGEGGFAPELEVAALKKHVELPIVPAASETPAVELLEVEDVGFGTGREILLPYGWGETDALTGLTVIACALDHAQRSPGRRLLVAGHTDTVGSAASNLTLSAERARNVYLYLTGDRAGWAAHCAEHQEVADQQQVYLWAHHTLGWDCDPGNADNQLGDKTREARDAFRRAYNQELGGALTEGEPHGQADWEAAFDLYDDDLARKLEVPRAALPGLRGAVAFTAPAHVGCGEAWPTEHPGRDHAKSAVNRRVDVLFFDGARLPDLAAEPAGSGVYAEGAYTREYLDVEDDFREPEPPPPAASEKWAEYGTGFFKKHCPLPHEDA